MISVAICDDSEKFVNHLNEMIEKYSKEENQAIKTSLFTRPLHFLDVFNGANETYDILFLDINMPGINGMEVAKKIRNLDKKVSIIFLTSIVNHVFDAYHVSAFSYIVKPINYKRLKTELNLWIQRQQLSDKEGYYYVKNDVGRYRVMLRDLMYVESYDRNTMIHTKDENIICYKKLSVLEAELKDHWFARCHASYIINLAFIKSIVRLDVKLITGETLPIGRAKRESFMQSLAEYWGEQL